MRLNKLFPYVMVSAVLGVGCIYPAERGKMLEERVDRLESDNKDLEQDLKKQRNKLDTQVAEVEKALEKLEKTAHRTGADVGVQLEQVQTDLSSLRGQIEQYQHKIAELDAALAQLKSSSGGADGADGGRKESATPVRKMEVVERPADKKAFAELVTKKLADEPQIGRELALEWLKKWPKDALAAKVHLGLGSSYMAQKDWRAALAEFGEIVKNQPRSEQAPDALLKSADCFAALKMGEESRLALEEIVNSYPKSPAASTAKTRLAELKNKRRPASKR